MRLQNRILISLANAGARNLTVSTIPAEHAYQVIKFRRAISIASEDLAKRERDLIKDCQLEIGEGGKLIGSDEGIVRFNELRDNLFRDESDIKDFKTIPFEVWHELKKENKSLQNALIEDSLEGVLWEAPTI